MTLEIFSGEVRSLPRGRSEIVIQAAIDGMPGEFHLDLPDLGGYQELLGMDDPGQALDAYLQIRTTDEPEPDPETGANVWAPVLHALAIRVQAEAREAEQQDALVDSFAKGMGPVARVAMVPYTLEEELVVLDDHLDSMRAALRATLGLPEPTPPASGRMMMSTMSTGPLDSLKASLIGDMAPKVEAGRTQFLDSFAPPHSGGGVEA